MILGWRQKEGDVKNPRAGPHGPRRCRRAGLTGEAGRAPIAIVLTSEAGKFAPRKNVLCPQFLGSPNGREESVKNRDFIFYSVTTSQGHILPLELIPSVTQGVCVAGGGGVGGDGDAKDTAHCLLCSSWKMFQLPPGLPLVRHGHFLVSPQTWQ